MHLASCLDHAEMKFILIGSYLVPIGSCGFYSHRSVPTNLKWLPNCSHAHALFQDRFKDVQVGSRWFSTLYILSPHFHKQPLAVLAADLLSEEQRTPVSCALENSWTATLRTNDST